MIRKRWFSALPLLGAALIGGYLALPSLFAEAFIYSQHHPWQVLPDAADPAAFDPRPGPALGQVIAGHWRVQPIAPDTYALSEPADAPDNVEYLLIGKTRALLIDGGATTRDIHPVLDTLTHLPVIAIPSHLHWDHTTGLQNFTQVMLIDLPQTRALQSGDGVQLTRHAYINNDPPHLAISEWIKPGATVDLGGRQVQVLSTPGHTATSVSIHDPANKLLFTGDFLYPTSLYAFMPDSSLSGYRATADRLLAMLPAGTRLYGAHCCRNDVPAQAPWLELTDLRDTRDTIRRIEDGTAAGGRGTLIRRYPVNPRMTMLTLYPYANR